ncbi:GldM family protein [Flavobacterium sp.]|uniref:GldM family protein n=1 Tax=Flavobacterium sp. TaxID=239 RepID=UPI00261BA6E3|nr:GldM family protein [Flavobacterium sp.]
MKSLINVIFLVFTLSFYGQNDTISVIKHTDKDIIVNKESKIVYRGMINSLSIEVPNCKSFKVTADGLTMVSKNLFNLNPLAGSEVIVTIDIVLKNGKKKVEKHLFKIKNLSNVITTINNLSGETISVEKSKLNNSFLKVFASDKNLNLNLSVVSFNISVSNGKSFQVVGNKITSEAFEFIKRYVSSYQEITISDIQVRSNSTFNGCIRPAPFKIKIL